MCVFRSLHYFQSPRLSRSQQVLAPAAEIPTDVQFFSPVDRTKPNTPFLKNHFFREGRIKEEHALWIIETATTLLRAEPNVLDVDAPITGESSFRRLVIFKTIVIHKPADSFLSMRGHSWSIRVFCLTSPCCAIH